MQPGLKQSISVAADALERLLNSQLGRGFLLRKDGAILSDNVEQIDTRYFNRLSQMLLSCKTQ